MIPVFIIDKSDQRNGFLATLLSEAGYSICYLCEDLDYAKLPFNNPYILILSPAKKITKDIITSMPSNSYIFGGKIVPEAFFSIEQRKIQCFDFNKDEHFAMLNAIPTAEGAIMLAIDNTPSTLNGLNTYVLGYGRIGKVLTKLLLPLGARVTVFARSEQDLGLANVMATSSKPLSSLIDTANTAELIINTIPSLILNKDILSELSSHCTIIDLASLPGGVDFEAAKELKINTIQALSLPGKVAPKSAAEYMKQTIFKTLKLPERID